MAAPRNDLGERLSGLEAAFTAFEKYERERWHKQDNDLQQLVMLPERLTREIAKIDGRFEGRVNSVVKDLERAITDAVEKAVAPVQHEVADHAKRIDTLEAKGNILTGAKLLLVFIVQTLIAVITALAGAYELTQGGRG